MHVYSMDIGITLSVDFVFKVKSKRDKMYIQLLWSWHIALTSITKFMILARVLCMDK